MVYPENFEQKIKFDKIRQLLKGYCQSEMGRDLVDTMLFSSDSAWINEQLSETREFMQILQEEGISGWHEYPRSLDAYEGLRERLYQAL
jgi:DNA mismatch repair protein MutS2